MIVTRILGDCPSCKSKNCFGNVSVHNDHVLRGCKYCKHKTYVWLPEIRKKVLYLDQFFFSGAFRGGDPRGDPRFVEAAARVKQAAHLQLLVAPYSSVHEDETRLWRGHKEFTNVDLLDFIKATSRGSEFHPDYQVEETQVMDAWTAFLKGESPQIALEIDDALEGALDEWDDYYRIDVGGYYKDVELMRSLKVQAVDALVNAFEQWRLSTRTLEQDIALETFFAGKKYLDSYITKISRIAQGDAEALLDSTMITRIVEQMLHWLPKDQPLDLQLKRCAEFFQSEHFHQVPSIWISARMFATLKAMVKRGAYAKPDDARRRMSGVFEDIRHISIYAPYCDAFFMDQPMADLVRQPSVDLQGRYGVRVFSLNNLDKFFEWIDELENGMSDDHKAGIEAAYPT